MGGKQKLLGCRLGQLAAHKNYRRSSSLATKMKCVALILALSVTILNIFLPSTMASSTDSLDCNGKLVNGNPKKIICVCDANTCSKINFEWPQQSGEAILIYSSESGARFRTSKIDFTQKISSKIDTRKVSVNLTHERQSILGWGGAFTDSSSINIKSLSEPLADKLLSSYYGPDGLQYNMGRVPIASSDFSERVYSYDDSPEDDFDLKNWSLTSEDLDLRIPMIKRALELSNGSEVKLLASPWSAPKWLKTNKSFVRGHLINSDKTYRTYAAYLMKFYEEYEKHGIRFWGGSVQNEPVSSNLPVYFFTSMTYTNSEMTKFIGSYLGPALEAHGKTKENFKLFVGDDSLLFVNQQIPAIFSDQNVRKYVSGVAFHWYLSGWLAPYSYLSKLYESTKPYVEYMIMSEACSGSIPLFRNMDLGGWDRGQYYASDIIEDLNRHTNAWIDWNFALDPQGGPNWYKNYVDSPIIVNKDKNEFYKQPMYYAIAHFSRLFRPGSIVLETKVSGNGVFKPTVTATAAINKESGHLIVNILNTSQSKIHINLSVIGLEGQAMKILVYGRSINSVVLKL